MSRDVEFIAPDASVQEIEVGALPAGTAQRIEGVVTDRDILYRLVARGQDPVQTRVRDILSRPVITCSANDTLQAAMDLMAANHIRRLPVQDDTGVIIGWITLADISRRLLVEDVPLQTALKHLTEPET